MAKGNADIYGPTWEKHDGKRVKIDGLAYTIRVRTGEAIYPYKHRYIMVDAVPVNKNSAHYQQVREQLRDDWTTDVLASGDELQADILRQLGE